MIFKQTAIEGVVLLAMERHQDDRGSFARTFSRKEFEEHGLAGEFVQTSSSRTRSAGTLRGMHLQAAPHGEAKLVRCVRGEIHDVVLDLRPSSTTRLQHLAFCLHQDDDQLLYIPPGCAHGFQTLRDDVEVLYAMSAQFKPEAAGGVRYDDPAFGIVWPRQVTCISRQDLAWSAYNSGGIT